MEKCRVFTLFYFQLLLDVLKAQLIEETFCQLPQKMEWIRQITSIFSFKQVDLASVDFMPKKPIFRLHSTNLGGHQPGSGQERCFGATSCFKVDHSKFISRKKKGCKTQEGFFNFFLQKIGRGQRRKDRSFAIFYFRI